MSGREREVDLVVTGTPADLALAGAFLAACSAHHRDPEVAGALERVSASLALALDLEDWLGQVQS